MDARPEAKENGRRSRNVVMAKKTLDDIFAEDDDLGLLRVSPRPTASSESTRIGQQFEEICTYIDRHGHAPGDNSADRKVGVNERMLALRLKAYRDNIELCQQLRPFDRHGLIALLTEDAPVKGLPQTLDDILESDDELLTTPSDDIFVMRNAKPNSLARPDKVSERKPCVDFESFKPLFDACAADLVSGTRKTMPFANEQEIKAGNFFILNGITVFVSEVNDPHFRNGKRNARLRLIFDNGTEGENLLRSLATELYKDPSGRRISDPSSGPLFGSGPSTETIAAPSERQTGIIYVVRSLSCSPDIARLDGNLFKIGVTTGTLEDRIRVAADDPTFLLAPVHPVRSFDLVNLNPQKVENLLHRFFAETRLDIEIMDRFGKPFRPREWFLLPLPVIEQAIQLLLDGSVLRHRYDPERCEIVRI